MVKTMAVGHYNHCEVISLAIAGWIDDQHLVYRNGSSDYFVFDTRTGTTAALFADGEAIESFAW